MDNILIEQSAHIAQLLKDGQLSNHRDKLSSAFTALCKHGYLFLDVERVFKQINDNLAGSQSPYRIYAAGHPRAVCAEVTRDEHFCDYTLAVKLVDATSGKTKETLTINYSDY